MNQVVTKPKNDEFLRNNAVFFVGSLLVAVLNYLYHPIISRTLSVEEFGQVQGYLSVAVQFGVLSTVFGMVLLNLKTSLQAEDSRDIRNSVYSLGLLAAGGASVLLLVASPYLGEKLSLTSSWGWVLVSLAIFVGMPRVFAKFHLQAEKRFGMASLLELFGAAGKIIFALFLIYLGFETLGAVGGYVLAIIAGLLLALPYTWDTLSLQNFVWPTLTPVLKQEIRYGLFILLAIGFVTFLYTADILVIRYLFSEETAGLYAGIATIARIIVFGTASVAGVLLSHVTLRSTTQENHQTLRKGVLATLVLGGFALAVFSLLPEFVTGLLMGESFVPLAGLLPLLSLAMLLAALTNLLILYCIALRMYQIIPSLAIGILSIVMSIAVWHSAVSNVVYSFIAGLTIVLMLLIVQIIRQRK